MRSHLMDCRLQYRHRPHRSPLCRSLAYRSLLHRSGLDPSLLHSPASHRSWLHCRLVHRWLLGQRLAAVISALMLVLAGVAAATGIVPRLPVAAARADDVTASANSLRTGWD